MRGGGKASSAPPVGRRHRRALRRAPEGRGTRRRRPATRSRSASLCVVKLSATRHANQVSGNAVIARARSPGTKRRRSGPASPRLRNTPTMAARVEGRRRPSASARRTSPASVQRGGGRLRPRRAPGRACMSFGPIAQVPVARARPYPYTARPHPGRRPRITQTSRFDDALLDPLPRTQRAQPS